MVKYQDHPDDPVTLDDLTPVVRKLFGDDTATVGAHSRTKLHGIGGGVGGNSVWRYDGTASTAMGTRAWTTVLKTLRPQPVENASGPHYWLREVEVYRSDFVFTLPGGIAAPECYVADVRDGDGCWLWLEFIDEVVNNAWPDAQFMRAARDLGRFNGGYLVMDMLPEYAWMSRRWLRRNLHQIQENFALFRRSGRHPLYAAGFPGDAHAFITRLWDEQRHFLDALDRLPKTVCHHDAFRRNLLASEHATYAIDWTFVGDGPIGADAAALLWVSFVFNSLSAERLGALYEPLFDSYLLGLRDAGWGGDPRAARLGYAASFAMRVLISAGYDTLVFLEPDKHHIFEDITGLPMDVYMAEHIAAVQPHIQRIVTEARRLV